MLARRVVSALFCASQEVPEPRPTRVFLVGTQIMHLEGEVRVSAAAGVIA